MISLEQIKVLYDKYQDLIKLETEEFGVKPTEVRHLIGRLGEFYCALKVNGQLSQETNQHGFDVVTPEGKRISVKTTAQQAGFVSISAKTLEFVDELMVIQYKDGNLINLYYGDIQPAIDVSRIYDYTGKYELDITKAKKLTLQQIIPAPNVKGE